MSKLEKEYSKLMSKMRQTLLFGQGYTELMLTKAAELVLELGFYPEETPPDLQPLIAEYIEKLQ